MKENRSETVPFFFFLNVLIREAGCMHKQGMCYRPLSFVWEARVQQGLTAWAFKGVSLAGTKTQPLHHEESDNLINVTIYSTRPSACPTAPQMLSHWPLYRAPTQQPFEFPLICADGSEKGGGGVVRIPLVKIFVLILSQLFLSEPRLLHCTRWTMGGPYLAVFSPRRLLCHSFISRP